MKKSVAVALVFLAVCAAGLSGGCVEIEGDPIPEPGPQGAGGGTGGSSGSCVPRGCPGDTLACCVGPNGPCGLTGPDGCKETDGG